MAKFPKKNSDVSPKRALKCQKCLKNSVSSHNFPQDPKKNQRFCENIVCTTKTQGDVSGDVRETRKWRCDAMQKILAMRVLAAEILCDALPQFGNTSDGCRDAGHSALYLRDVPLRQAQSRGSFAILLLQVLRDMKSIADGPLRFSFFNGMSVLAMAERAALRQGIWEILAQRVFLQAKQ